MAAKKDRVLWADDEIDLLKPHILFLQDKGYEVVPVVSGQDAIDCCKEQSFDIIFLDEPTAGLDALGRVSLHEQIRKLKSQGKTIVLASHDMEEVESLCDRIAILNNGSIAFCGTAAELTDKIGEKYFIHIKTRQGDSAFETDNIEDTLIALIGDLKQKEIRILDIKVDRGTLERHFIEMARRETE